MNGAPVRSSRYLTMRDGVRVAIDLWLPAASPAPGSLATIVHQTRYMRSKVWRPPFDRMGIADFLEPLGAQRNRLLAEGYAWVDVDSRGSGASFGQWPGPWYRDEVADGAEVVDHIIAQPWSNGRVGATGISYSGTTAERLATTRHPAVKAVVLQYCLFDIFTDVAFPGGVHLSWFTEAWNTFNQLLDRNCYNGAIARMAGLNLEALGEHLATRGSPMATATGLMTSPRVARAIERMTAWATSGVRPVDDDRDRALLRRAVAGHADNLDVHKACLAIENRDDTGMSPIEPDETIDMLSPHRYVDALRDSGAAILSISGWYDGAYQHAAIKRFLTLDRASSHLLIGPWDHGGRQDISPFTEPGKSTFDFGGELTRFFNAHLRAGSYQPDPVRYFTMGAEEWRSAPTWPPPSSQPVTLHLRAGGALDSTPAPSRSVDNYRVDLDATSGRRSRWRSYLGLAAPVGYPDRASADSKLLCFTGSPLANDTEITGHPVAHLFMTCSSEDATIFVYLEEVSPSGAVSYVTEGQLRARHRAVAREPLYRTPAPMRSYRRADARPMPPGEVAELVIDLLPTSYRVPRGHRVRLAIAGADRDHFTAIPPTPAQLTVHSGPKTPSRVILPVVG